MIVLAFLLAVGIALVVSLVQAFFVLLLLPYTGISYDPTFWQVYILCLVIHILTAKVSAKVS